MVVRRLILFVGWVLLRASSGEMVRAEDTTIAHPSTARKLGGACSETTDCLDIKNAFCDTTVSKCQCKAEFPISFGDKECLAASHLNETCHHSSQCKHHIPVSECHKEHCICPDGYKMKPNSDNKLICHQIPPHKPPSKEVFVDPTMLGVLAGLVVMFIIMCIVLRMFSKARFREQRTIFNDPRMMKMSLSRAKAERRGSRASGGSKAPSRQPSIASGLNIQASSRRGSQVSLSNANIKPTMNCAPLAKDDDSVKVESPKSPKNNEHPAIAVADKTITAV